MGLLQLALDAWLGTTAYAFCRRAGIFASPRLELVPNERVRFLLSRYLQFGETSASKIESATEGVQAAANQMRSTSGSPGSVTPSQAETYTAPLCCRLCERSPSRQKRHSQAQNRY
eukprot:TRINITY_DN29942_c0_g1_i1.p1 TRINITY_DN29942_c0_g1~~TRINITY_DN29942_c0_g1_i1.p1  ORF type:complete len:116 (+),score=13.08 TRINITY_DN29942_c0_g1_i1:71-418(+)